MKPEELLEHAHFVHRLALRLVSDEHRAADIEQQTWVAALEHPPPSTGSMRGWLARVASNFKHRFFQIDTRRTRREKLAAPHERTLSTDEIVERAEIRQRVVEAVLRLDDPYRSMLLLRYYEDLSPREIARNQGVPIETVRTRLKRGLVRLKNELDAEHGGSRKDWLFALAPIAGLKIKAAVAVSAAGASANVSLGGLFMALKAKTVLLCLGAVSVVVVLGVFLAGSFLSSSSDLQHTIPAGQAAQSQGGTQEPALGMAGDSAAIDPNLDRSGSPSTEPVLALGSEQAVLVGRVVDDAGKPLAGVAIESASRKVIQRYQSGLTWEETGLLTDEDGSFWVEIPELEFAASRLCFRHETYCSNSIDLIKAIRLKDGTYTVDDIVLVPAYFIQGQVEDHLGKPVTQCTLCTSGNPWEDPKYSSDKRVKSDEHGRFLLKVWNKGLVRILAWKEGVGIGECKEIKPGPLDHAPDVTLLLEPCLTISGTILNADGSPAAHWRMGVNGSIKRSVYANEKGAFVFPSLPLGKYDITANMLGFSQNILREKERIILLAKDISAGRDGLVFHLPQGSKLLIELKDKEGMPIIDTPKISIDQTVHPDKEREDSCSFCNLAGPQKPENLGEGIIMINNIRQGCYSLDIEIEGYAPRRLRKVEVPPAPEAGQVKVVLTPTRSIRGSVHHATGETAPGVTVSLERFLDRNQQQFGCTNEGIRTRKELVSSNQTVTGEGGVFKFDGVEAWVYKIVLRVRGNEVLVHGPFEVSDEDPNPDCMLMLPVLTSSIEGKVLDSKGIPIPGAVVVTWDGQSFFNRTRADDVGKYAFKELPAGRYIVDARAISCAIPEYYSSQSWTSFREGFENLEALKPYNAILSDGGTCHLYLVIDDPWNSRVEGDLFLESLEHPPEIRLSLGDIVQDKEMNRPIASDLFRFPGYFNDLDPRIDAFSFQDLRGGSYKIRMSWNDSFGKSRYMSSAPFYLHPSTTHRMDLSLHLAKIQGDIVDKATGTPITGARAMLRTKEGSIRLDLHCPKAINTFQGDGLPVGEYTLVIHHDAYRPFIQEGIRLMSQEKLSGIQCEMEPGCSVEGRMVFGDSEAVSRSWFVCPVIPPVGTYWQAGGRLQQDGTFRLTGVPTGPVELVVMDGSKPVKTLKTTFPIPPGEDWVIEFP